MGIKGKDEPNIYRDVNQDYQQLGGEQPQTQQTGGADFDYYQALKDENYKSLLNNQVQLANARQQALKNTNVGLNAMGFGSAGYGALQRNGIESAYMQGLEQNQNDFATRNLDINKQQFDAEQNAMNENFKSFNSIIGAGMDNGYISSTDQLNDYFGRYGFLDNEGNFDRTKVAEQYGEESAKQMELMYEMWKSQLGQEQSNQQAQENGESSNGFNFGKDFNKNTYKNFVDDRGKTGKLNDEFAWLEKNYNYIKPQEGTYLKISDNGTQQGSNMYFVYRNGSWVQTTAEDCAKNTVNNKGDLYWLRSYQYDANNMLLQHNGKLEYDGKAKVKAPENVEDLTVLNENDTYIKYKDDSTGITYSYNKNTGEWVRLGNQG